MRPTRSNTNSLENPFDLILGYPTNIQILRTMFEVNHPISKSKLSSLTGISLPGIHKTVNRLIEARVIQNTGSGKQHVVEIRENNPFVTILKQLFITEAEHFIHLKSTLIECITSCPKPPLSVWIYGSAASDEFGFNETIKIGFLDEIRSVDENFRFFQEQLRLLTVEKKYDVMLEISPLTKADLNSIHTEQFILLWGISPKDLLNPTEKIINGQKSHKEIDDISLSKMKSLMMLLRVSPEIIDRTMRYLEKRISNSKSATNNELMEWLDLLKNSSLSRLSALLNSNSDRAIRLRQSLPFWMVLNDQEQRQLNDYIQNQ